MPLPVIPEVGTLTAHLRFNTSDPAVELPPGASNEHLATFEISGEINVEDYPPAMHRNGDTCLLPALAADIPGHLAILSTIIGYD